MASSLCHIIPTHFHHFNDAWKVVYFKRKRDRLFKREFVTIPSSYRRSRSKAGDYMSDHYYSRKPQSKSNPKTWQYQENEKIYQFTTDDGVFSKHGIDYGTRLLIEYFKAPKINGALLDLGCGYGPIGVLLADRYPDRKVTMVDVNERALELAQKNLQDNQIDNAQVIQSDGFANITDRQFAAIITNPPIRAGKKVVYRLFEESKQSLLPNGELWIVIQKKQGAPSAQKKLATLFKHVDIIARQKGYFIIRALNA